jgi:phosphoribosylformylglycinamidine synthase
MSHVMGSVLGAEVKELWHKDTDIQGVDLLVVPGGFSYGDYLRSGAIARFSPIMAEVQRHARRGGLVFGVCNGFQILCESGLLPGTLLHNTDHRFICKNTYILPSSSSAIISATLPASSPLEIPIAHAEGRYHDHPDAIKALQDQDDIIFRYCDEQGQVTASANPNGSVDNIAGVCNKTKNVFGMMPHPERAAEGLVGNEDGLHILSTLMEKMPV